MAITFNYLGYPAIETSVYNSLEDVDLFILCQHGFNAKDFTNFFPELLPRYNNQLTEEIFIKYLDIEHDFGTKQLAHWIANTLRFKMNVSVIEVRCNRGIMDPNRISKFCIPPLIKTYTSKKILSNLKDLNFFIKRTILFLFEKHLRPDGYIFDLHSMWPYDLNINPNNCSSFREFTQAYKLPKHLTQQRKINFIMNDINGMEVGCKKIASSIEKELAVQAYNTAHDDPYYIIPEGNTYYYLSRFQGVAIDIPRNLLGNPRDNSFPDFSFMHESKDKIKNIGESIAKGILNLQLDKQ